MSVPAGAGGAGAGGDGGAGAGGAPAGGAPAGTPPAGGGQQVQDWTTGLPEIERGYVQNKGWKGPGDLLTSYQQLEKTMGVPPDQLLRLPKADDAEGWGKVYERLGRPAKAEDYKFEAKDAKFAEWARGQFHKLGFSGDQAANLVKEYNSFVDGAAKAMGDAGAAQVAQEEAALKQKWGAAHQQNINIAKAGAAKFGLDGDTIDKLQSVMGFQKTMEFMHSLGAKTGEHSFVNGGQPTGDMIRSPEAAMAHIRSLQSDSDFQRRYMAGDAKAIAEWNKAHAEAYHQEAATT